MQHVTAEVTALVKQAEDAASNKVCAMISFSSIFIFSMLFQEGIFGHLIPQWELKKQILSFHTLEVASILLHISVLLFLYSWSHSKILVTTCNPLNYFRHVTFPCTKSKIRYIWFT